MNNNIIAINSTYVPGRIFHHIVSLVPRLVLHTHVYTVNNANLALFRALTSTNPRIIKLQN